MKITPTNFTVTDYCDSMLRNEIVVNRDYQRSDKVWPPAARSFLIETILLNFSIPKLSLFQVTDVKSKKTIKEVIDGQQRSSTILDFHQNRFKLSKTSEIDEAKGKKYSELSDELKQTFLEYSLSVDLFVSATPQQIREVFRRINSYTVPLNAEEHRHAVYQGELKWFIYRLSKKHDSNFVNMGLFVERQLIRMADTKILADITNTLVHGIKTTTAKNLNDLYATFDNGFPKEKEIESRIDKAVTFLMAMPEIHKTALIVPHLVYSLILAISHMHNRVEVLQSVYKAPKKYEFKKNIVLPNLSALAQACEDPKNAERKFEEFLTAGAKTTNEAKRREIIFTTFCKALEPVLI